MNNDIDYINTSNANNINNNISKISTIVTTPVVITQQQQQISETTTEKPITTPPPPQPEPSQIPDQVIDVNDTNNNNYQKVTTPPASPTHDVEMEAAVEGNDHTNDETDRAVVAEIPQDTNNNSTETDEKTSTTIEGIIQYSDDQWSPANISGKKYYTRDQLLKLKDAIGVAPIELPEGVSNTLMKFNKDFLTDTLTQQLGMRNPYDAVNSVTPKWLNQPVGRNPYPPKRTSQQGNKQAVIQDFDLTARIFLKFFC